MEGARLGEHSGLWATGEEIAAGMLHVSDLDESPVVGIFEGMFLRLRDYPASVYEVLLDDYPRERFFLVDT